MTRNRPQFPRDRINEIRSAPAAISVGKNGITDNLVKEIQAQLKKSRILKIRFQKSILEDPQRDRAKLAGEIIEKTRSVLYEIRGNTIIIYKS